MSIIIKSLTYVHPDKELLFERLSIAVVKGDKASLVGNNGTGKSTLLQIISGQLSPLAGEVLLSEKPWYVPQHLGQYDALSIAQALGADKKLAALQAITGGDANAAHFTDLEDDWEIEDNLNTGLAKWGLDELSPAIKMSELSGGEKTKVFLAGIDIWKPGVILLDEPTNHLDAGGRNHLYNLIMMSKATILVISHDRTLLNLLPKTLELSRTGIEVYGGNFDFYKAQKQTQLTALQAQLDEQSKSLKQTQQKSRDMAELRQKKEARGKAFGQTNSLPRIAAGGLKSKAEQSTAKVLDVQQEKTDGITENIKQLRSQIQQYQALKIDIGSSPLHHGKVLVNAEKIGFRYQHDLLWEPLSFQLRSGDRVRIEGDNGAGKTTLLKIITGVLDPTDGDIKRAPFNYLYLDQDYTIIKPGLTIYEQIQYYNSRNLEEHQLKSLLIYSQFPRDVWDRKCAGLSGGEKMKLSICCLAVSNHTPDVLILDEPTNNLDVQSLEVLTASVKDFTGTLILISHDQYFIDEIGINTSLFVQKIKQAAK